MKKLTCIVIDDDEIDQLMIVSFVKRFSHLELKGVFSDAATAFLFCQENRVDVLFLDIDMHGMSGLELRKRLAAIPICVFVTAHPEHAVESFELETLDYIVKPLKFNRFLKTIERIDEFAQIKTKAFLYDSNIGGDSIYIKEGHEKTKVSLHEILYLEALKDYTLLVTTQKRHCVFSGLGALLKEGHFQSFVRIHRSFAVPKLSIAKMNSNEVTLVSAIVLPIGRSYRDTINALTA